MSENGVYRTHTRVETPNKRFMIKNNFTSPNLTTKRFLFDTKARDNVGILYQNSPNLRFEIILDIIISKNNLKAKIGEI